MHKAREVWIEASSLSAKDSFQTMVVTAATTATDDIGIGVPPLQMVHEDRVATLEETSLLTEVAGALSVPVERLRDIEAFLPSVLSSPEAPDHPQG